MLSEKRLTRSEIDCRIGAEAVFWDDVRVIIRGIIVETHLEVVEKGPGSRLQDVSGVPSRNDALSLLPAG